MTQFLLSLLFPLSLLSCHNATSKQTAETRQQVSTQLSTSEKVDTTDNILSHTINTQADSARVVELLKMKPTGNDALFYARKLKGIPYVASTLEVADPEQLVVNLRELDCTTLVETTLALALTKRQHSDSFADYCHNLQRLRYWDGQMNGYLSRLHYFSWWWHNNKDKGIIKEVTLPTKYTTVINVQNNYMSVHPDRYKFLKLHPEWVDSIARMEQRYNGPDGRYLMEQYTSLSQKELSAIHDGDLIAIVTTKKGIDYSHLGFAVWGKDGKLHLLNASSIHHKVVEEPKTLHQYLKEHPSSIGIRLWRM